MKNALSFDHPKYKDQVIVKVPLALDAEISESFSTTEIYNPPTLYVAVDREAFETKRELIMGQIYKRVYNIERIAREKGLGIIELLKERGYVK